MHRTLYHNTTGLIRQSGNLPGVFLPQQIRVQMQVVQKALASSPKDVNIEDAAHVLPD